MKSQGPACLLRRSYGAADLLSRHPPMLQHPHKRLVFKLACPPGTQPSGTVELTRWGPAPIPARFTLVDTAITVAGGFYDYQGPDAGIWHVNFADPHLFVAYGSPLLAQDELQAAEHPLLGCLREALLSEGLPALTAERTGPTPVLIAGVERRCVLETAPDPAAGRPEGLYGNRFAIASARTVRSAVRVLNPPSRSNLISIAAPSCGFGPYRREEIERVLLTAYTGFSAAVHESARHWPGVEVEVRTGFWGCGAFGGNRRLMVLLQALAARLAGIQRLRFHAGHGDGEHEVEPGLAILDRLLAPGPSETLLPALLDRILDLDFHWGMGDGN